MNTKIFSFVLLGLSFELHAQRSNTNPDYLLRQVCQTDECFRQCADREDLQKCVEETEANSNRNTQQPPQQPGQTTNGKMTLGQECALEWKNYQTEKPRLQNSTPPQPQALANLETSTEICRALQKMADYASEDIRKTDSMTSIDKKITCYQRGGYTLDYKACTSAVGMYNMVLNAETALNLTHKIMTDVNNKKLTSQVNESVAKGNVQEAAIDASIANNNNIKNMNQQRAMAYSAAVAALSSKMSWPSSKIESVTKNCQNKFKPDSPSPMPCDKASKVSVTMRKSELFANEMAHAALKNAIVDFIQKGIAAGMAMNQFGNIAKKMEAGKQNYAPTEEDVMIERCALNPADPACVGRGNRVSNPSTISGTFGGIGSNGNNSFGMGDGVTDTFGEEGDPSNLGSPVADVTSPFAADAKAANDILNPAAAAAVQPGGGSAGGGGGGGGAAGGGGGGASLGDDLEGANTEGQKDPTLKSKQTAGNYEYGGGGGYKSVQGGKPDANPFQSMFDNKSQGGVEEDRSIASGDIDGQASGLFQKISKKYGQMQADKRIEALNLE